MFELQLVLQNHQVSVRANGKESHRFSLLELSQSEQEWKDFYKNPRAYGEKLFNALFRDAAEIEFDALSKQSERTIVLVLESPELDGVAWEYAYNKAKEEYVVEDCAFVRALPGKERPAKWQLKSEVDRVPLLFIPANPLVDVSGEPLRALDEETEWKEICKHITASNAGFDLLKMLPATPEQLQTVMAQFREGLIVHFSGHGGVEDGKAILLFEEENGASKPLDAREFVREIKDKAAITFLSACQSAVAERTEFSNLARELAKAGVPFALGMQFNLPDPFAPNISGQFYNYLAHGHAVPEAARQARRAVKRENEFFVGMIALYAVHPDEAGKLVWRGAGTQTVSLFRPADVSDLPSPASGLIGRQRELMRIGTRLLEGKKPLTVTLHGAGGIGKTALLWQAFLRFAPFFELTLAIGLDALPSLESVLGRIERFLGLPSPCANETKERETLVQNALTSKRTLLGLDNFETLNYALNEKDSDEEKTAKSLHTFFKSLAANGVTLCVTSREVTNLPGEAIEDIQGLTNENGGRLFQENVVKQKDEIYIEKTQQVSEMVGGHPLALRLLAGAFDDQVGTSLDQYMEDLQSFLPKARDKWTEEDRHESLRASFDFTMNNLVKTKEGNELQIALSRLSMFVAFFADFTAALVLIGRMFETEEEIDVHRKQAAHSLHALWERGLLERAIIELPDDNFYLYHIHPALRVFAREQLSDVETVKGNYRQSLINLIVLTQDEIGRDPLWTQIARFALPDLLIATSWEDGKSTAPIQFAVGKLLMHFCIYDDALRLLKLSHDTFERLGMQKEAAVVLGEIAGIYLVQGNLDKVLELRRQELTVVRKTGDKREEGLALYGIAHIYRKRGDLNQALELGKESLETFERLGDLQCKSVVLHEMASVYFDKGDLDGAMKVYKQSLEIDEGLGDQGNKSTTLHALAKIHVKRGDLDTARTLAQQSLGIFEELGDFHGKASALGIMSEIDAKKKNYRGSLLKLIEAMNIYTGIGANPDVQAIAGNVKMLQAKLGFDEFEVLWKDVTGQPLPEWLAKQPEEEQGMTAEQFIAGALQSAREKRPEAEEYFKSAQKMAADSSAPKELKELGRVLSRILAGDMKVDLSGLPIELKLAVEKGLKNRIV